MYISQNGLNLIKEFEGCTLQSYDDYNDNIVSAGQGYRGTLTIGWGHIENVYAGQSISQQNADDLLMNDMVKYCSQVQEVINEGTIGFAINQNMFDALVSFDYNVGQGCVRTLCRNRDKDTVADMLLEYRNKGSQWEQGLLRRRTAERNLFLSDSEGGQVANPVEVPSQPVEGEMSQLQGLINEQGFGPIKVDNIPGEETLSHCPFVKKGANGEITKWIQLRIGANPDGDFGDATKQAVKWYQQSQGIEDDGEVGRITWSKLLGL